MSNNAATLQLPPDAQARLEMLGRQGKSSYEQEASDAGAANEKG